MKKKKYGMLAFLLMLCFYNIVMSLSVSEETVYLSSIMTAQAKTGEELNRNIYYKTNPFEDSGEGWTQEGDFCDLKGDDCPDGIWDEVKYEK